MESLTHHGNRLVELEKPIQWVGRVAETIWLYAEQQAKADGAREVLVAFNRQLAARGLLVKEGTQSSGQPKSVQRG